MTLVRIKKRKKEEAEMALGMFVVRKSLKKTLCPKTSGVSSVFLISHLCASVPFCPVFCLLLPIANCSLQECS